MFINQLPYRFYFDADTGDGGGTSTGEGNGAGDSGDSSTQTGSDTSGGNSSEPTFSQADLDRIAGRTRQEALAVWAKKLGFDDPAAIEELVKKQKAAAEKEKSDLEKAQEKAQQAEARRQELEQQLQAQAVQHAFDRAASDKVADLDLAYLAAQQLGLIAGDKSLIDVKDGKVTGMDKAVEKLLEAKPLLKKQAASGQPGSTGGSESSNGGGGGVNKDRIKARFGL